MVKAGAGKKKFLQNAFHAELLACLAGVKMASTLGLQQVVLETDASLVKMALEGEEYRLSALSGIITEI
jgi:ribonuclease HI